MDSDRRMVCSEIFDNENNATQEVAVIETVDTYPLHIFQTEISFYMPSEVPVAIPILLEHDEDGDIIVKRKVQQYTIILDHCLSTPLQYVGLQVWSAALLLSDFLLFKGYSLLQKCIMELGAGVGICSMIAALFGKCVFCTDVGNLVLSICQKNIKRFCKNWDHSHHSDAKKLNEIISIKEFNWCKKNPFVFPTESDYGWSDEEKKLAEEATVFLASDVIYDDCITSAFFDTVTTLMEKAAPCCLILSLEKRLNFVAETLDVRSPPYDFFLHHVKKINTRNNGPVWRIELLSLDFPQYFHYERTEHHELWLFECLKETGNRTFEERNS